MINDDAGGGGAGARDDGGDDGVGGVTKRRLFCWWPTIGQKRLPNRPLGSVPATSAVWLMGGTGD